MVEWIVDLTAPASSSNVDFPAAYDKILRESYNTQVDTAVTQYKGPLEIFSEHRKPACMHSVYTLLSFRGVANFKQPAFLGPRIGEKLFLALLLLIVCE